MTINKDLQGSTLTVALNGRLDTLTSPELDSEIKASIGGITELIFDMGNLDYISSAGLRVLLSAQKVMNRQGSMLIRKAKPEIMEVFEVTGFVDILSIEE